MKLLRVFLLIIAAYASPLFLAGCSLSPVAGGTETGNPVVTIASSAFDALDSSGQWLPSAYLPAGSRQLTPGFIYDGAPVTRIAKQLALLDTAPVTTSADTPYTLTIVKYCDTVVSVETTYVYDTVASVLPVRDTLFTADHQAMTVVEQQRYDTSLAVFKSITYDTSINIRYDTVWSGTSGAPINMYPAKTDTVRIAVSAPIQYRILTPQYMDSKQPDSSAAENRYPSSNSLLGSVAFLSSVDKKYTSNGTEIYELYKDTDGNGILYTAATGLVPQMKLYATYMNGTSVTELLVCFDAGADRNCDSIKDNRIISLNRRESDNGIERELIEYGKEFLTSGEDTAVLSVKKFSPVNSAESTVTSYICLHGTDTLDHRLNALHSFAQNLTYRSGTVHSISSSVILPSPLAGLSAPATASIHAVVRFTDGHEAVLDGTVDFTVKTLTGTYTENGKTAAVKYEKTGDKLDVQE